MYLGQVTGTIWATVKDPNLQGKKLVIVQPQDSKGENAGDPIIAVDLTGSGPGEHIFYITSREASDALEDVAMAPVDATILGIVDRIDRQLKRDDWREQV